MMSFAMQTKMHNKMMLEMKMKCCDYSKENNCNDSCCISSVTDLWINLINLDNSKKILKVKLISFINIFDFSSKFLENKNLLKTNSPPFLDKKIKYYSYSDLVKIIKSNT
jgi:hypothetical protein